MLRFFLQVAMCFLPVFEPPSEFAKRSGNASDFQYSKVAQLLAILKTVLK